MNAVRTSEAIVISSCLICAMFLILLRPSIVATAEVSAGVPPQAAAVGYITKTFSGTFSKQTVDLDNTGQPGFDWYPRQFFEQSPSASESVTINGDGSMVIGA